MWKLLGSVLVFSTEIGKITRLNLRSFYVDLRHFLNGKFYSRVEMFVHDLSDAKKVLKWYVRECFTINSILRIEDIVIRDGPPPDRRCSNCSLFNEKTLKCNGLGLKEIHSSSRDCVRSPLEVVVWGMNDVENVV